MNKGRILVTGGAGFIGSALIWALNELGRDDIIVCDRLNSDERWRNLRPLRFADYVDADELPELLNRNIFGPVGTIFHFGACSDTGERDMGYLMRNNFYYTRNLAIWALSRKARFVYASSAATYGDGCAGMDDDDSNLKHLRPLNPYAYSKHIFDIHAQSEGFLHQIVGIKYFNVFGPNENHKGAMRSLVHRAFDQVRANGRVELFKSHRSDCGDGLQSRDFLYVKDAVAMTLHLAELGDVGGLFNLGSGTSHTWIEFAKAVFAAMDRPPQIDFVDMPEGMQANYQYHTCANIRKLAATGYSTPVTPLAGAVRDCVVNFLMPDHRLGDGPVSI